MLLIDFQSGIRKTKDKYIGEAEVWEETQNNMKQILDNLNLNYKEQDGE